MESSSPIIIADTNVLINFLKIERLDLIAEHSRHFVITDHVRGEVTDFFAAQKTQLDLAIRGGIITEQQLISEKDVRLFGKLAKNGRLGHGECSAIACAINGEHDLAIDDKKAIREALKESKELKIFRTQDLMVSMIRESLLSLEEADEIKKAWENFHRFRLNIDSFAELIDKDAA